MAKNIRRGRTNTVRCGSCGQIIRRDRAVYLFRDGIKVYYCPDCAKKIHGAKLYKGIPRFNRKPAQAKTKRKFVIFSKENEEETEGEEPQSNESTDKEEELNQ